jgi:hypothetical protein
MIGHIGALLARDVGYYRTDSKSGMGRVGMTDHKADASFVFEGTVKALKSSNVASIPADSSTATVVVDHVRQAPRALAGLAGKQITLKMEKGENLKAGERALFSADGFLFAENLALQSRGHDPLTEVARSAAVIGAVPVVQKLLRRVEGAQTIVSGRVSKLRSNKASTAMTTARSSSSSAAPKRISEHEPFWQQAVIDVSQVHKGPKQKQVVVNFPASTDVMWRKAPKFTKGQTGVFLLHAPPSLAPAAARTMRLISPPPSNAYIALDPDDYQPPSAAPAVMAMLPETPASVVGRRTFATTAASKKAMRVPARGSARRKKAAKKAAGKSGRKRG